MEWLPHEVRILIDSMVVYRFPDRLIPLGKTEAGLTKQVEELSLYIVQLNKEVEALKGEVEGLKNGEGR